MHARTQRRFEDRDRQRALALLDGPIGQDDNPLPLPGAQVPGSRCERFAALLLRHDLAEQRQRFFIVIVQIIGLECLHLLWHRRDAQIPRVRREPCEVSLRLVVGQPLVLPAQ